MPRHPVRPLLGCAVLGILALSGCGMTAGSSPDSASFDPSALSSSGPATSADDSSADGSAHSGVSDADSDALSSASSSASADTSGSESAGSHVGDAAGSDGLGADGSSGSATGSDDAEGLSSASGSNSSDRGGSLSATSQVTRGSEANPSRTQGSSTGDVTPACTFDQVQVTLTDNGGRSGAAGSAERDFTLQFANSSARDCSLTGTPEVAVVSANNGQQQGVLSATSDDDARTVILEPGDSATASLALHSADSPCTAVRGDGLLVFPPGSSVAAYVPHAIDACATPGHSVLTASAVTSS